MRDNKMFFRFTGVARFMFGLAFVFFLCFGFSLNVSAKDLDEIINYDITVDVNEDATLHMVYHIDWKVLDSTSDGPLSWVIIGNPNKHCSDIKAVSSNIKNIRYTTDRGSGIRIDFDREYYADEVVSFDFEFTQDYMYQMNLLTDGETVYSFTPGWFDDIEVDNLIIHWNADKALGAAPPAIMENGYYEWETSLAKGAQFKVDITYPNDAYPFSKSKNIAPTQTKFQKFWESYGSVIKAFLAVGGVFLFIYLIIFFNNLIGWMNSSGFKETGKEIRRTVIEYYPNCPGCGAPRPEGAENCVYCGMNFVKSEKIVEEKKLPKKFSSFQDEIFKHKKSGTYATSDPNTYVRVTPIIVPHRTSFASYVRQQNAASRSRSGGGHSSCAHSSCACACACACAGGGRAGCTAKDFYKTNLKMKYFEKKER